MKKSRINNKGYSLVELLLTMAVFAIVMLGIASMMRATSVNYKDGNFDINMQTEAQIVANQIEELLVDATGDLYTNTTAEGYRYWRIDNHGYSYYLLHDTSENVIRYQKRTINTGMLNNDSAFSLMAEYVEGFNISGYSKDAASSNCDNKVTVEVTLNNHDYKYTAVKDVFFRNAIENKAVQEINGGGGSVLDPNSFTATFVLDRYHVLDLEKEFNVDRNKEITITSTTASGAPKVAYFEFATVVYNTENMDYDAAIKSVSSATGPTHCIRLTDAVNKSWNSFVEESDTVVIEATDIKNQTVRVRLVVQPVKYVIDTNSTGANGHGAFLLAKEPGDNGRFTWLVVEGIDFNTMVSTGQNVINYSMVLYQDTDGSRTYSPGEEKKAGNGNNPENNKPLTGQLTKAGYDNSNAMQLIEGAPTVSVKLAVDTESDDLLLCQTNTAVDNEAFFANGDRRLAVYISVPGGKDQVVDFNVFNAGNDLSKYKGGNLYTSTKANFGL